MILRTAVATLAFAASAPAAATAGATVATPSKPTHLTFNINALAAPISGKLPTSLSFAAPGFTFDPKAVARRCQHEQAVLNECPAKSRIATGVLNVHVVSTETTREAHLTLNIYLQTNKRVLAVAFIGGPKVVPATVTTSHGLVLSFNPLPQIPPFPGLTLTLDTLSLNVGTSRVLVTRKHERVHGKNQTIVKRTRYDLLHTPSRCSGTWPSSTTLGFAGGVSTIVPAPIACRGG